MLRSIALASTLLLAVAAACAPPASQQAPLPGSGTVVRQEHLTITDDQVNACNGESVHLAGDVHIVFNDHDGVRDAHVNGHLTGTGSLGNDYLMNLQARADVPVGGVSFELVTRQLLISKGGAPNQLTTVTVASDPLSLAVVADCRG